MLKIPESILTEIRAQANRPEGSITFVAEIDELFNQEMQGDIIFNVIAEGHIFLLERDSDFNVNFYHFSPGTGTRMATINLNNVKPANVW